MSAQNLQGIGNVNIRTISASRCRVAARAP